MGAFDAGVGDARRNEFDRANGVVISGNWIRDVVGIAVAVDDGDDRDFQPGRLLDRKPLVFLMPVKNFCSFTISFPFCAISFLVSPCCAGSASMPSSFFILSMLRRIVWKLISMPPSQR